MTTLTIRLPDDTHARLRQLAKQRKMSLNKFIELYFPVYSRALGDTREVFR